MKIRNTYDLEVFIAAAESFSLAAWQQELNAIWITPIHYTSALAMKASMRVDTSIIQDSRFSILLMLFPSEELLAEQARIVSTIPGQVPVRELHITLMPSAHSAMPFPAPPSFVELCKSAYLVAHENKTSVYLRVTEESQRELSRYVTTIEEALHVSGLQNKNRIFHVSLTNLVGRLNESVANVWEYPSMIV